MKVIITGGTGMVGRALAASLLRDDHDVIVLTRSSDKGKDMEVGGVHTAVWDGKTANGWGHLADGVDAIVNLAGANLSSGRWTIQRKQEIVDSRRNAGQAVVQAVEQAAVKPKMVFQASGSNFYGVKDQGVMTEDCPKGDDFLADVCEIWENATAPVESMGVRRVITRSAAILNRWEGALPRMSMPFKFFVGGPVGRGQQWFPWIHLDDVVRVIRFGIETDSAIGVYNLASPDLVNNYKFCKTLGKVLKRPSLIPVPPLIIKLLFGEMSTIVLDGNQTVPSRLKGTGYVFAFPNLEKALRDVYKK